MFDLDKCEKVEIPQGYLYLGTSNEKQSVRYLELKPNTCLTLHNRPAIEKLTQVKGVCDMIVYKNGEGEIVRMSESDEYTIEPAGTYHIHANPYAETSLTYWDFDGDITEIINTIKTSGE